MTAAQPHRFAIDEGANALPGSSTQHTGGNIAPDTTVCTVGVARPSAQGQAMIRTDTAAIRA